MDEVERALLYLLLCGKVCELLHQFKCLCCLHQQGEVELFFPDANNDTLPTEFGDLVQFLKRKWK